MLTFPRATITWGVETLDPVCVQLCLTQRDSSVTTSGPYLTFQFSSCEIMRWDGVRWGQRQTESLVAQR